MRFRLPLMNLTSAVSKASRLFGLGIEAINGYRKRPLREKT
jgi:hypothetical protein